MGAVAAAPQDSGAAAAAAAVEGGGADGREYGDSAGKVEETSPGIAAVATAGHPQSSSSSGSGNSAGARQFGSKAVMEHAAISSAAPNGVCRPLPGVMSGPEEARTGAAGLPGGTSKAADHAPPPRPPAPVAEEEEAAVEEVAGLEAVEVTLGGRPPRGRPPS
mmetsp:Transcript_12187/g.32703  ORF Transcript_12187/g.32703 Transcript_12187/m.32703 type:complete len:163 (+) Transcript_12187:254-742(+)